MELIYYLQTFYERIAEQLYGGNVFFRNKYEDKNFKKKQRRRKFRCCFSSLSSDQSVFIQHCRKIAEQLQRSKPVWDQKVD